MEEVNQRESIKLIKNTKGYNFELKVLGSGENNILTKEDLDRVDYLNNKLLEKYGEKE
jgi:hypothetical protein